MDRSLVRGAVGLMLAAGVGAVVGGAMAAPAERPARVIEAEEFRLVDAAGKARAFLAVGRNGATLSLCDAAGNTRAGLCVTDRGPGLGLLDAAAQLRASLVADKEGSRLTLYDAAGRVVWSAPRHVP